MASFAAGKRIIFAYKVALSKDHKLGEMGGGLTLTFFERLIVSENGFSPPLWKKF